MPNVVFISKGLSSASTRYRAQAFFPILTQHGWHPVHIDGNTGIRFTKELLTTVRAADVVVVLRRTFSGPFRWALGFAAKKLVFDFDDAIFTGAEGKISPGRARGFASMLKKSTQVWAGNSYLAAEAQKHCQDVRIVPTVLDVSHYTPALTTPKPADFIDLVWIGSSTTKKYLQAALPILDQAHAANPRLRLKVIADFDLPTTGIPKLITPWSSNTEAADLASSHIGIAPMPDDPWTRGKCAFKVIQYMAAALPVISSNTGANKDIVAHNQTGLLVDTPNGSPDQWLTAISQLASDPTLRDQMGQAGRARALAHYDLQSAGQEMANRLNQLI
jgi:glycosyltransferase involved in cell wall biosynthesis